VQLDALLASDHAADATTATHCTSPVHGMPQYIHAHFLLQDACTLRHATDAV
jgi:hypothetical protein